MRSQEPLKQLLESPTDEARISRMWSAIRDRREPRQRPIAIAALAAAVLLAAIGGATLWRTAPWRGAPPGPAELRLADGTLPSVLTAAGAVALEDGSSIELGEGARVESIDNGADRFVVLLARGSARFSVQPGGPRRWVIEGGLATVEVVGTVFTVHRRDDGVEVRVERGVVLVRGERVPDRVRRLTRGQSLFVTPAPEPPVATAQARPAEVEPPRDAPPAVERIDPVELALSRADAARRRGDPASAVVHLRRAATADGDPRASLAAFTLGRVHMDELHRPEDARRAFERALRLGLPEHLAAQAQRRIAQIDAVEQSP